LLQSRKPHFFSNLQAWRVCGKSALVDHFSVPVPDFGNNWHQVDRQLAVGRPQLLRDVLDQTLSRQRMMATLGSLFGAVLLLLAVLGLYGVMAQAVAQRTPEIGIRVAMGAQPASIVTLLLGYGLRLLGIGVAMGLAGAYVGTRTSRRRCLA